MFVAEHKFKLRAEMLQRRKSLEPSFLFDADKKGELLAKLVLERWRPQKVGLYWPKDNEFPTQSCIETLRNNGVQVYLPVVSGEDLNFFCFLGQQTLVKGNYGVYIPPIEKENQIDPFYIDTLIIPGVAYDRNLRRLGYGKGFYDRFLPKLRPPVAKVGLCYSFQVFDQIPFTDNDQPVNFLFTESWTTI